MEDLVTEGPALTEARRTSKRELIELAVHMAERIVRRQVEMDPSVLESIYEHALAAAGSAGPATIRIHPEDRAGCGIDALARRQGFAVVDDRTVGRCGCVVEAGGVRVDARLETALGALARALDDGSGSNDG